MPQFAQSCSQVGQDKVIGRIAAYRKWSGVQRPNSEPGVCQICGHTLSLAYRVSHVREDGLIERADVPSRSDEAEKVAVMVAAGLIPDGMMVFPVHVCPVAEDEALWNAAKGIKDAPAKEQAVETQAEF